MPAFAKQIKEKACASVSCQMRQEQSNATARHGEVTEIRQFTEHFRQENIEILTLG